VRRFQNISNLVRYNRLVTTVGSRHRSISRVQPSLGFYGRLLRG
jgi:hypothetical protein